MIEEHFLPTTILRNMSKQKIFDDLLINMKRRVNQRKITLKTDSNFTKILEEKVELVDKINNELNGINNKEAKSYKKDKIKRKKTKINRKEIFVGAQGELRGIKDKTAVERKDTLILPEITNRIDTKAKTKGNANNNISNKRSNFKKQSEYHKNNQTRQNTVFGQNVEDIEININCVNESKEDRDYSKKNSIRVNKENLFFESNKETGNNINIDNNRDIILPECYNNNSNININNTLQPSIQANPSKKLSIHDSTIENLSSKSLAFNNFNQNLISTNQNLNKNGRNSRNSSVHTQSEGNQMLENKASNNLEQPTKKIQVAPSKFSSSLNVKDQELENILVNFNTEDRRKEILLTKSDEVQLFIDLFREKLENNNDKIGNLIVNIRPATLKPGSKLSRIYNKCLKEFKISLEMDKVLNNEKNRSISAESKEFGNFMKFFKKEQNFFIEEIFRIKEKNQNRKVFLYNKSRDPSNIDISKISDNLAYVNRKFFIERYGFNYNEEADFIFQDLLNNEKGVSINHKRAEEKRNKKHEKIENYLDNTIKKKKELISHLSKKLSTSGEK